MRPNEVDKSNPRLSVVIPYCGDTSVFHTISSLQHQTLPADKWELIVVCEDSAVLPPFTTAAQTVVAMFHRPGWFRGHTAGILRNIGSRIAKGSVLVFVDSDCVLSPECLESHLRLHRSFYPKTVVCGFWLELPASRRRLLSQSASYGEVARASTPDFRAGPARYGTWRDFYSGNASLCRATALGCGGFDEQGFRCHDMDLGYRLSLCGCQFRISPECSAVHIEHPRTIESKREQAEGWLHLGRRFPAIRTEAHAQTAALLKAHEQIGASCEKRFLALTDGMAGERQGCIWHCSSKDWPMVWRRVRDLPLSITPTSSGVQVNLRLHRNCWDYGMLLRVRETPRRPRVTIALTTFNREDRISDAISSVLVQTVQDFELLVIDDASTDATAAELSRFASDPRIRIFFNRENRGLSHCLNKAAEVAKAPILLQLDSDDCLHPQAVEWVLDGFTDKSVGSVFGSARRLRNKQTATRILSSLAVVAPRAYRISTLRRAGGWATDDSAEGRFFEDRLMLARLSEVSKVSTIPSCCYEVFPANGSLSSTQRARVAKFSILYSFANSRALNVQMKKAGRALQPKWSARRPTVPSTSWSVVIPIRNRQALLEYCLRSWSSSDITQSDHEIIVVDDGSDIPISIPRKLRNVRLIRLPASSGAAYARNCGAAIATNKMLFFCDGDHIVPTDVISQHEQRQRDISWDGVVIGSALGRKAVTRISMSEFPTSIRRRLFELYRFRPVIARQLALSSVTGHNFHTVGPACPDLFAILARDHSFSDLFLAGWAQLIQEYDVSLDGFSHRWLRVGSSNLSVSSDVFRRLGGFDARFRSMEDWELGARLQKAGLPLICAPLAEPLHQLHERERTRDDANHRAATAFCSLHGDLIRQLLADTRVTEVPGGMLIRALLGRQRRHRRASIANAVAAADQRNVDRDICLTFDDGPHPVGTPEILHVLRKHSAKATFFLLGEQVQQYPNLCATIVHEGHEIAVHGWQHERISDKSTGYLERSLQRSIIAIQAATGVRPRFARPTYGISTPEYAAALRSLRLCPVSWDVSAHDWAGLSKTELLTDLFSEDLLGRIILLHDGAGDPGVTALALNDVLGIIRRAGVSPIRLIDKFIQSSALRVASMA